MFLLGLITSTDKLNDKGTKKNEVLQRKCGTVNFSFTDNSNIYSNMLNSIGLHLHDCGTTLLVSIFATL